MNLPYKKASKVYIRSMLVAPTIRHVTLYMENTSYCKQTHAMHHGQMYRGVNICSLTIPVPKRQVESFATNVNPSFHCVCLTFESSVCSVKASIMKEQLMIKSCTKLLISQISYPDFYKTSVQPNPHIHIESMGKLCFPRLNFHCTAWPSYTQERTIDKQTV